MTNVSIEILTMGVIVTDILLILLGGLMMYLWGMIRGMQSIIFITFIEVSYAGFAIYLFKEARSIAQVDIFYGE